MKCPLCFSLMQVAYKNLFDDRYGFPGKYNVSICTTCEFGKINTHIKDSKIGQFYAKYYPLSTLTADEVSHLSHLQPVLSSWLMGTNNVAHLYIKPHASVLDIGSGSGESLLDIKKLGGQAYGVEPDPYAQKIAQKLHLRVFNGFIIDNPFPDKKFDFITASQVLEHDSNPNIFLNEIKKKLKKNGVVILSFPNCDSIYKKICGTKWINWHVPYHCNFFTKKSFKILANDTGYKIIRMITITPNMWTILQIRRLLAKTRMGEKNPIWNRSSQSVNSNRKSFINKTVNIIIKILINVAMLTIIPLNRVIDVFGQGDSLLVWLEKSD